MKIKIKLLLSLLIGGIFMTGCKKDLEENPKYFISPDNFFANASQCTQAVNGAYSSLYTIYGAVNFWQVTDLGTDLIVTADASNLLFNNYTFNSGNTGASGMWSALYTAIKNANLVINTDADQIIIANVGAHAAGQLPPITYTSGGLEDADIRRSVCDILEGGERAFKERARRLRVRLQR